jgi:hypothetical protein
LYLASVHTENARIITSLLMKEYLAEFHGWRASA